MFISIPQIMERFGSILEATLNSNTGRKFTGGATIDVGVSKLDEIFPSLSAGGCTSCFTCKVRAIFIEPARAFPMSPPRN